MERSADGKDYAPKQGKGEKERSPAEESGKIQILSHVAGVW